MSNLPRGVLGRRLAAQLISGVRPRHAVDVVERILAVQGQDFRGFRLAVRARSNGLTAADVHRSLDDRSLVVTWLNRGTLHLVRSEDYPWLLALLGPPLRTQAQTRLAQEGVTPTKAARAVSTVVAALRERGPLVRSQIRDLMVETGGPAAGQGLVYVLFSASLDGLVVRGPVVGAEQAFVAVEDWLPRPSPVDRQQALVELVRRYLAGHGPASDRDLAYWTGLPLGDVRAGLRGTTVEELPGGLVDLPRAGRVPRPPEVRLLGAFDPVLHGWVSREVVVGEHGSLVTSNGIFRPTLLVRGRAAGTWGMRAGAVTVTPFVSLTDAEMAAAQRDAERVERFFSR